MPNLFAHFMLFMWPLVAIVLFRLLPRPQALAWTILGGYLFLPERLAFDFPMLPAVNKVLVPAVSALLGCLLTTERQAVPRRGPRVMRAAATQGRLAQRVETPEGRDVAPVALQALLPGWVLGLVLMGVLLGMAGTTLTNGHPVPAGPYMLPAMRPYDMASQVLGGLVALIPFLLGWRYLGTAEAQRSLLAAFAIGGALYAPLALFEVRMSPQLSMWIYGFFPHSFAQHMRGDGFRPVVFLEHGLWLSIFLSMSVLSALGLWRLTPAGRTPFVKLRWLLLAAGLMVTLVLSKSLGALVITLFLGTVVLFFGRRLILLVTGSIALAVLLYPMLRGVGLVPTDLMVRLVEMVSVERAGSLQFRLRNEDLLLARANEQALFGWGIWGRGFIYDARGYLTSVTDGQWVLLMNVSGWVGYLLSFGLLCLPTLVCLRPGMMSRVGPEVVFLSAVLSANLLDLIPNTTLEPITWLLAGAMAGSVMSKVRAGSARERRSAPRVRRKTMAVQARSIRSG